MLTESTYKGLSGVRGNSHAPFLGGGGAAMCRCYPTRQTGQHFIRYDDRPWSEKEFNRLQTFTQIVSVVTEQIQSRVVNNVDYELLCRERDNFRCCANSLRQ